MKLLETNSCLAENFIKSLNHFMKYLTRHCFSCCLYLLQQKVAITNTDTFSPPINSFCSSFISSYIHNNRFSTAPPLTQAASHRNSFVKRKGGNIKPERFHQSLM